MSVRITGLQVIIKKIERLAKPDEFFDKALAQGAAQSVRRLVNTTNKGFTKFTVKGWSKPSKLGLSRYLVENKISTYDGKHSIAKILDQGRKAVYPKKPGGRLYIPLTKKGATKKRGEEVPKNFKYGVDYVLAKSSRAFAGTKFIQKELVTSGREIGSLMIQQVRRVF